MRTQIYFTGNEALKPILNLHIISQGSLYHYTKKEIATKIIERREFRLSRADTFLDDNEINYGLVILRKTAEHTLKSTSKKLFIDILNAIDTTLKKCYVLSLSNDGNNQHLLDEYSDGKTIIKLREWFPNDLMYRSFQYIPNDDSNILHYTSDIYTPHEGFVVYQQSKQKEIAQTICNSFQNLIKSKIDKVDNIHFINAIAKFIILCKVEKYYKEEEYRIALISNNKENNEFDIEENNRIFIALKIPGNFNFELLEVDK